MNVRSFCCLLLLLSCQRPAADLSEVTALYDAVNRNRYTTDDSLQFYVQRMAAKAKGGPPVYRAMALIGKGLYCNRTANYPCALQAYSTAIQLLEPTGVDSLLGKAYNGMGAAHRNMGEYPQAIERYQQALQVFERMGFAEGIAGVNSNLALTYQSRGDSLSARRHLRRGLEALGSNRSSKAYLNLLHLAANEHAHNGAYDSALLLDNEGIRLAAALPLLLSPFLDNKAQCFWQLGRPDSARLYFQRSLSIDSALSNTGQMADTYLSLGRLEAGEGRSALAATYLARSIALGEEAQYRQGSRDAWKELSLLYEKEKNYARALEAQNRFAALNDSIISEATEKRVAELQTGFETARKEAQIAAQSAQLEQQRLLIAAIITAGLLALIAAYAYYRRRGAKKKAELNEWLLKQQQEATIQILTAEEKERQRIAVDLHDGIGQTMTAAWLNLQALGKRLLQNKEEAELVHKTTALVGDSCAEIRQVSHNMMPNALQRKGLVNAVREFTGQLDEKIISVHLQADEDRLQLAPTAELILYRVIQECVNNVVKHAEATELDISIVSEQDGLDILIEDNGKGFQPGTQPAKGLGIQNIHLRIRYLNGTVEWNDTGSGTVVAIHIPYDHAATHHTPRPH